MNKQEIEKYLQMVGEELQKKGLTAEILLLGAAVMLLEVGNRNNTDDIDALFSSTAIYEAAQIVAKREGLMPGWLNEGVAVYVHTQPPMQLWKVLGGLQVYLPPLDYLLAMKLLAHRSKDEPDIMALKNVLGVKKQEAALTLLEKYVPKRYITPAVLNGIKRHFEP